MRMGTNRVQQGMPPLSAGRYGDASATNARLLLNFLDKSFRNNILYEYVLYQNEEFRPIKAQKRPDFAPFSAFLPAEICAGEERRPTSPAVERATRRPAAAPRSAPMRAQAGSNRPLRRSARIGVMLLESLDAP